MITDAALLARADALVRAYAAVGKTIATAESCTGGLVAGLLTAVPGSSAVVERGFVTYSNEAKAEAIGVPMDLIVAHGAVSEPVARAMAEGALRASRADVAVSVTGIAGPGGGSAAKPVGLVHFGLAAKGAPARHVERRFGDLGRSEIRHLSVVRAIELLEEAIGLRPDAPSRETARAHFSNPGPHPEVQSEAKPRRILQTSHGIWKILRGRFAAPQDEGAGG